MFKKILLLSSLLTNLLHAQNAVITGKFPYQRNVSFSLETLSNQIIFIDDSAKTADTSDVNGQFSLSLKVPPSGLIRFTQRDQVELYLRPGDSLWIEMINARNISFRGSTARENTLLALLEKRPFIPQETLENPAAFSAMIDTIYSSQMQRLAVYEADQPDPQFVSLYLAKVYHHYLSDKMKIYQTMNQEGLEGDLLERIRRQIRAVPLVDETRVVMYIHTLQELFSMEALTIMGQELLPATADFGADRYPEGFTDVFESHVKERLASAPQLSLYFELQHLVRAIETISNLDQWTKAASALARITKEKAYAPLAKAMQLEYRKREIQFKLGMLPVGKWKTPENQDFQLLPSPGQRTLLVFWDASQASNIKALQSFQRAEEFQTLQRFQPNTFNEVRDSIRFIWVQLGGDLEAWQRSIAAIPNVHKVQHCYLNDPAAMAALKPYFFQEELPIAFKLKPDLSIAGMHAKPDAVLDGLFDVILIGGRMILRGRE